MSKLDDLIAELCPNGVEYRSIGSIITRIRERGKNDGSITQVYVVSNTQGIVRSQDYHENEIHSEDTSNYTIIRPGMFAYNPSRLNIGSLGLLKYNTPGLVSPMYVVFDVDRTIVDIDYLLYNLKSSYVKAKIDSLKEEGARFRFDFDRWRWIRIPVPPIKVQKEVVRILDTFIRLSDTLTAEHKAREQQYESYTNSVLYKNAQEFITLEKCCESIADGDHQPPPKAESGVPFITISNITNNRINFSDTKYVPESYYNQLHSKRRAKNGDVLYSVVGSFGIPVLIDYDRPFVFQRHIAILRPDNSKILSKFLYYCMKSRRFYEQADSLAAGAAQRTVSLSSLNKMEIPLLSLDMQRHVISILDRFDKLCNDTYFGLPAEISARKKQYEYYRDKLLSFKDIS